MDPSIGKPNLRRRIVAIVNPISGRRDVGALLKRVEAELTRTGASFSVRRTEAAGHAVELARQQIHKTDALLVLGGDGTICEVANGICGTGLPLALVGTGTENLFARAMGLPSNPGIIARALTSGSPTPCDVNRINGRVFLSVAGAGFDAECVVRMSAMRRGHITHADYFWPLWRTFWGHRFPRLRIEADGGLVFDDQGLAIIGGLPRYAVGLGVLARARVDDGLLDVCAFRCRSRQMLVCHAMRVVLRRHLMSRDVVYRQCRHIRMTSTGSALAEADGDFVGQLPIDVTIEPRALSVLRESHEMQG